MSVIRPPLATFAVAFLLSACGPAGSPEAAIQAWYDAEGPFAGTYALSEVLCSEWIDVDAREKTVDVAYAYCDANDCSASLGIDDRRFTVREMAGDYAVLGVDDALSGRCSEGMTAWEGEDTLLGSSWRSNQFGSLWTFTPVVMGNMTLAVDGAEVGATWISEAPWPGWTLEETYETYLVLQSPGFEPYTYGVELTDEGLTLHHDVGLGSYRADTFVAE